MRSRLNSHSRETSKDQRGIGLAELIVAIAILFVGLTAILELALNAAYISNKNGKDTSATLVAQTVLEQISSQSPNSTATDSLTDCTGTVNTIATAGGAAPNGTGANLDTSNTSPTYGLIDWSQQFSNITANYAMKYTDCDANGHQTVYDVRWNIITISANETRLITVSARQLSSLTNTAGGGGLRFAIPVTLRGVGGP
jgi:Tfp pilus assembly protein PilV